MQSFAQYHCPVFLSGVPRQRWGPGSQCCWRWGFGKSPFYSFLHWAPLSEILSALQHNCRCRLKPGKIERINQIYDRKYTFSLWKCHELIRNPLKGELEQATVRMEMKGTNRSSTVGPNSPSKRSSRRGTLSSFAVNFAGLHRHFKNTLQVLNHALR